MIKDTMNKTILVPVDFKQPSVEAAAYGCRMAQKMSTGLLLLYVIDTPGILAQFFSSGDHLVKVTDEAKEKLIELAKSMNSKFPDVKISTRIERGKPYEKILETCRDKSTRMIILGENHQCGDPEDELGTTVYHVTLKSKVPVLTLKGDTTRMKDKIVVPLDLTKETREKLSAALFYGKEYGAKIHLVSALVGGIAKKESRIYKKMNDARETLEMNGVECEMKLFDRSKIPPFKRVLEYAEKVDAGMILLMTHQEGYTHDNYIGAFAHHILNLSNISVLSITSVKNNLDFAPFFKSLIDPMGVLMKGGR
ncbi:MAG: universal stress protein [Bacteroidota bacterium]